MNITLLTNVLSGTENSRLSEEATKFGHTLSILEPQNLTVHIENNTLSIPELDDTKPNIVILRGVLVSVKKIVALISYCRSKNIKVFDNNLLQMQYSINKTSDLIKLGIEGLPLPNTFITENFANMPALAEKLGYPLIVKPIDTGKGIGVTMIKNQEELTTYVESKKAAGTKAKRTILQQFIPYLHDLRILVIGDQTFCMKRIPPQGDFRANFSIGGTVKLFELDKETKDLAITALRKIDMSIGGVDILITDKNERYLLEVNHSPGFEGMEKATDTNIALLFLTHAITSAK